MTGSEVTIDPPALTPSRAAFFEIARKSIAPRVAPYRLARAILRWRARKHGGMFPQRMWTILKRYTSSRRRYFIAKTSNGIRFVGDFHDIYPVVQLVDPSFQVEFVEWMAKQLATRPGAYVDVGANLGILAASMAKAHPDRPVLAFEPAPETAARAAATFALNHVDNVSLFQAALSDFAGTVSFALPRGGSDRASIHAPDTISTEPMDCHEVACTTLDRLARENLVPPVALVKIDVEGHEPAVIRGMLETLKRDRPIVIFEYVSDIAQRLDWNIEDVIDLLKPAGYTRFHTIEAGHKLGAIPPKNQRQGIYNIVCE